jgi:hypothetical protein
VPNKKLSIALVFILTASFYIYSLLPSLAWGDGAKLQSEAVSGESFVLAEMPPDQFKPDEFIFSRVGVAAWDHPLYIVMGHLLVKAMPGFDSLWLVNLISAVFGAASVALVFLLTFRIANSFLAACYAAISLAFSHTFWWHSSTPEVYTLLAFLLLMSFYFFDKYERTNGPPFLFSSAFFLGLAASTHILAFLIIPALALYFLSSGNLRRFRIPVTKKLILPIISFLIGFSLYILQFVRMSANFPVNEIMGPVIGSTFLSQLGNFSLIQVGESLLYYLFFLTVQFGPLGLVLGGFGIRKIFQDKDWKLLKVIFSFIAFAIFGIFYRVTDQFTFFIPSYIFWAMIMGLGSDYASKLLPEKTRFLFPVILALLLIATPFFYISLPKVAEKNGIDDQLIGIPRIGTGVRNGLAYYINPYKRGDTSAYDFGNETISNLAPNSIVIAEWYTDTDEYFIFRYFTKIKKLRSDVTVTGWANQDPFYFNSQLTLDVIEESFPERPVYLASLSDRFYAASKLVNTYCVVPENNLYRLYEKENSLRCLGIESVTE